MIAFSNAPHSSIPNRPGAHPRRPCSHLPPRILGLNHFRYVGPTFNADGRRVAARCFVETGVDWTQVALSQSGVELGPIEPGTGRIHLFGVEHTTMQPWIGQFIAQTKPQSVVFETAVSPAHESQTGNVFSCEEQGQGAAAFMQNVICQSSSQLSKSSPGGDVTTTPLWKQMQAGLNGEMLAYVSTLCTGAPLVFGDRPKGATYARLNEIATVEDLDLAFGEQSKANYLDGVQGAYIRERSIDPNKVPRVELVTLLEREAIMCQTMYEQCKKVGENGLVVGVVGAEHVKSMAELWRANAFEAIVKSAEGGAFVDQQLGNPGVRRALLEGVIRLSAPTEVLQDMQKKLGEIPEEFVDDYWFTTEVYGSTRMLLAVLDRETLGDICCGCDCDMYDVLEPFRAIRPINGGKGYDYDVVNVLRALDFEIKC